MRRKAFCVSLLVLIIHQQLFMHPHVQADQVEIDLGRKFSLVAQAQLPLVRDYIVQRYIQRIGQRIVAHLEQPEFSYQFAVVQDNSLNAFSVPGGYIYFNSGLILRVDTDDELAGVIGHEIAHVQGHHMLRQQQDTKLLSYASLVALALAIINPVLAAGASSAAGVVQMKYMRQLEEEADYRGLQYMRQAGFDPHGMPRFLKKMGDEERLNAANVPVYLRSHPLSQDRLSYIERILGTMRWNQTTPTNNFELKRVQAILRTQGEPRSRLLAEYQQNVNEAPEDAQALALLGVVQARFNDLERARQTLEQASAKGVPLDDELGAIYLRLGLRNEARRMFARLSEVDPNNADAHNQLCKLLWQEGELERAKNECQTAVTLDPPFAEPYLTLAQIAQQQDKAADTRLLLAQAMERQGRLEAALSQYQQALALLGPDHPKAEEIEKKAQELEELVNQLRRMGRR
jgi:predicted Zn-dependent protease